MLCIFLFIAYNLEPMSDVGFVCVYSNLGLLFCFCLSNLFFFKEKGNLELLQLHEFLGVIGASDTLEDGFSYSKVCACI